MEIARYTDCVKVLEGVVNTSDDNVEAWYLLAYANYSAEKYTAAQDCVNVLHQLFQKPDLKDQEIEDATAELETKLKEIKETKPEKMEEEDDKDNNEKGEDYEDIEDDDEDKVMGGDEPKKEGGEHMEDAPGDTMHDK